jgi:hypothetical protein
MDAPPQVIQLMRNAIHFIQIDGQAFSGITPTITPVSGEVTLYKYESFLGKFDSISTTPVTWSCDSDFNLPTMPEGDYIYKSCSKQLQYYKQAYHWYKRC